MKKFLVLGALSLFCLSDTGMVMSDAHAMRQETLAREQREQGRVEWTQAERERHIEKIENQVNATQAVLQQQKLTSQQIIASEDQITIMLGWLMEVCHYSSHEEWAEVPRIQYESDEDSQWIDNAPLVHAILELRRITLKKERQKLSEIDLGQDSQGRSLNTRVGTILDSIENMLNNLEGVCIASNTGKTSYSSDE